MLEFSYMANLIVSLLTVLSLLLSTTSRNIEKAFLQNNPKMLYSLFASEIYINISLPEPISFSDQLSNQQAYFLFQKIFSSYSTFEFYSEEPPLSPEVERFIFKASWSFKDKRNNNQYVFNIFFYLTNILEQKNGEFKNTWKITEIKAERI